MKAILGKKIGMTQIFAETGEVIPVTVIQAGPEVVTQIKTVTMQCRLVLKTRKRTELTNL